MFDRLWDEGKAAWPEISPSRESFAAYVGARSTGGHDLRGADLFLACACVEGDSRAITAVSEMISEEVTRSARGRSGADDVAQTVRVKLLVGDSPRIAEYAGRGSLRGWLRVVVARAMVDAARQGKRRELPADDRELFDLPARGDPELSFIKDHYREEFRGAFEAALRSLEPSERRLLRHQFADRLSIDQIGALYRIHRATAARQLSRAREELLSRTRRELSKRLELGRAELESVMRLIQSQLHVSLCRLLEQTLSEPGGGPRG